MIGGRRERCAEPGRRAHRRGDGCAWFGCRARTGRRGVDARPLENFLAAFRLSQRAQRVIRQNLVISLGNRRGAGVFCAGRKNSAHHRRHWPRRQHGRRGDEQPAVVVWRRQKCESMNRGSRCPLPPGGIDSTFVNRSSFVVYCFSPFSRARFSGTLRAWSWR